MRTKRRSEMDRVYNVLGNPRRRTVLDHLAEHGPCDKGELAERVADEHGTDRETALIGLHQAHLPKMADAGAIDYDQRQGHVAPGPLFPTAICVMDFGRNRGGFLGALRRLLKKGRP